MATSRSVQTSGSLESRLFSLVCIPPKGSSPFPDYRRPNEVHPEAEREPLSLAKKGVHVVAGTERLFFHLLASEEESCDGIVGMDVNPKVKAYNDFVILALRVSKSREDFAKLTAKIDVLDYSDTICRRRIDLRRRILCSEMEGKLKCYYADNLDALCQSYFEIYREGKQWQKMKGFSGVLYDSDEKLFWKLHNYAVSGRIVSLVGDIRELECLGEESVSVIDVSNIHEYTMLFFKMKTESHPLIIFRDILNSSKTSHSDRSKTSYGSFIYKPLTVEQQQEFDALFSLFEQTCVQANELIFRLYRYADCRAFQTAEVLEKLKQYVEENVMQGVY